MKTLFISLCLLFSIGMQAQKLKWKTDFTLAKQQAIKTDKPILMYFTGSDWCAPCKQLKTDLFATKKFKEVADNFVLLLVDFPFREDIISKEQRQKNEELAKVYNPKKSFPTLVGVNGYGSLIKSINGYSPLRETHLHYTFLEDVAYKELHWTSESLKESKRARRRKASNATSEKKAPSKFKKWWKRTFDFGFEW